MKFVVSSSPIANFTEFFVNPPVQSLLTVAPKEENDLWRCVRSESPASSCAVTSGVHLAQKPLLGMGDFGVNIKHPGRAGCSPWGKSLFPLLQRRARLSHWE